MDELKRQLSKKYTISVCKKGYVFTLYIIGEGLSLYYNCHEVIIQCIDVVGNEFPNVEVAHHGDNYLLLILKP